MVTPGKRARLTAEIARATWDYDPETGLLHWKVKRPHSTNQPGDLAGCITKPRGEWVINYGAPPGNIYKATHIIWLIVTGDWPTDTIDHKDNWPPNNRWENLRLATHSQQQGNRGKLSNNESGFKGVSILDGRYMARIRINGKLRHLGMFDTGEEAHAAYMKAAIEHWGEFARS